MQKNGSQDPRQTVQSGEQGTPPKLPIVAIGASAGGLEAFKVFFDKMPADTGMVFVLIPHLDPGHKSMMVEIIGRRTAMTAVEVEDRMTIEPDHVYIVPPNRNLAIEGDQLVLSEISRARGINLPVDHFFRSVAAARGERTIGIILSGTMRDGAMGLKDIKAHGGLVIAQSPETAQQDGMPQSAIDTGMVDFILPVAEMPDAIVKFIAHPYIHGQTSVEDQDELNQVLAVVRARSRHDFRCYKPNTLIRRTERRMGLRQLQRMADYIDVLKSEPKETDALLKDLLIGVTGFFREERVWEKVGKEILPPMVAGMDAETPLRIWIPGCSTGEEAYTVAMLVQDVFERANRRFNAQIFATDIDGDAILAARSGVYPETIAANVPPEFLKKYFVREGDQYHILRRVRESVVFAVQNLVADAPFSYLDLISCRNLLIYLNADAQKSVMGLFHFSLKENGCLILGSSETIGYHKDLFSTVYKKARIYRRTGSGSGRPMIPSMGRSGGKRLWEGAEVWTGIGTGPVRKNMARLLQTQLLKRLWPAAVLCDRNMNILSLYGPMTQYLELPQGEPVMELAAMAREGLRLKLRAAFYKAVKENRTVVEKTAQVKRDDRCHPVRFTVDPVRDKEMTEPLCLVAFEERPAPETGPESTACAEPAEESLVWQLESELTDTREDLQNTIEELETANEELKASNEEMMSMNEELQSSNEELETAKEELQSMNEELGTVNAELQDNVRELEAANNDMVNLMNSTEVATVFLNLDMTIRRFTPAARRLFNLIPSDVGRPIGDLTMRFSDDDLRSHAARVLDTLEPSVREVETDEGRWYIRRVLPFRTQDDRVDGLVLTFADVTDLKKSESRITRRNSQMKLAQEIARLGYWTFDIATGQPEWSDMMFDIFGCDPAAGVPGYDDHRNFIHPDDWDAFDQSVQGAIAGTPYQVELRVVFPDGGIRHVMSHGYPQPDADGNTAALFGVTQDITERRLAESKARRYTNILRQAERIADMGSWEWKVDQDIAHWSDGLFRIFKRDPAQGAPNWAEQPDFFVAEDFERFRPIVEACVRTGEPYEEELRAIRSDGEIRHCVARGEAERGPDGNIDRLFGVLQDITERKQTERALAENEKRRHQLMDALQEGVWAIDAQGNTTFVNPSMAGMLGYSTREMQGKQLFDFMDAQGVETAKRNLERRKQGISEQHEFVFRHRSGAAVHAIIETAPLLDADGVFAGAVAGVLDITDRKRIEQRLEASRIDLELAQRIAHVGNWSLDPAVGVPVWSDEIYRIYERDPALGPPSVEEYQKMYAPDQYGIFHRAIKRAIEEGKPYDIHLHLTLPLGKTKWVHAVCRPDPNPGPAGHFLRGTIQDVTEIKHAEEKLQAYSHRLEEMVAERTRELEAAQKELLLKERLAVLGHFSGSISHELRNPLAAIDSAAYLLNMKYGEADEKTRSWTASIQDNVTQASEIIASLLSLTKMKAPETRPTGLDALIDDALSTIRIPAAVETVRDLPDPPPVVEIDPQQLRMVLKNLFQNAVQAMAESGQLGISARPADAGYVEILISDTGPGIPPESVERVFDPLFSTKTHGIGFGLSIVKMIVENHGGEVRVGSGIGGGAVFTIILPWD